MRRSLRWNRMRCTSRAGRRRRITAEQLEDRRLLAVSAGEQDLIYLLNRARHDPVLYATQQSLPVSLAGIAPRGPLAVNTALLDATEVKANDLATHDYFAHVGPSGVHPNRLARDAGYPLPNEWIDDANYIESLAAGPDSAVAALNLLLIDNGLPEVPHRMHLLGMNDFYASNREIGVGFAHQSTSSYEDYWVLHLARRNEPVTFLTGVVHDDVDGDGRYRASEGLAGVTVLVDGSLRTQTNAAGGWSIAVQPGQHNVVVSGGDFRGVATASATVTDDNVEVDFMSGHLSSYVDFAERYATNISSRFDVNESDRTSALDALHVLNFLRRRSNGESLVSTRPMFLDVSGDGNVTSLDALQVINELQRIDLAQGEAESVAYVTAIEEPFSFDLNARQSPETRVDVRVRKSEPRRVSDRALMPQRFGMMPGALRPTAHKNNMDAPQVDPQGIPNPLDFDLALLELL